MGVLSNKIDRKQLKAGDHIYSWRKAYLYAHHGIYLLENGFGDYHFFKNNCEDFAVYCKTELVVRINSIVGGGGSGQVASYLAAVNCIASLPLGFVKKSFYGRVLVHCGMYCIRRLVSDIGFRSGVTKVPVEKIHEMARWEN